MNAGFVFFNHDMPNWLTMNVCSTRTKREVKWSPMFEIIVDCIWSRRNEFETARNTLKRREFEYY